MNCLFISSAGSSKYLSSRPERPAWGAQWRDLLSLSLRILIEKNDFFIRSGE